MDLSQIYTEVITEHNRSTHNRRSLPEVTHKEHGHNPSCGDDITLELDIKEDKIIDAAFTGTGCAISQASTSMMIDLIKGLSVTAAKEKTEAFLGMIKGQKTEAELEDVLEDAVILANIKNMPARVKCAVLAWHTLDEVLKKQLGQ
ncbi:SUF system NifU family Fe-S cluster assembly protein [Clostridiales bacterium COT073_COT-073]|nr:SUF system NifU family Fe-S cluster assembly protein [Clostridiales bacterium COT073_COT-073]